MHIRFCPLSFVLLLSLFCNVEECLKRLEYRTAPPSAFHPRISTIFLPLGKCSNDTRVPPISHGISRSNTPHEPQAASVKDFRQIKPRMPRTAALRFMLSYGQANPTVLSMNFERYTGYRFSFQFVPVWGYKLYRSRSIPYFFGTLAGLLESSAASYRPTVSQRISDGDRLAL